MHTPCEVRLLACGDTALAVEFGDAIDAQVSALVLALAERLAAAAIPGLGELVPTFRSLTVYYDPCVLSQAELKARLRPLLGGLAAAEGVGRLWRVPACYDASLAPDMAEVAHRTGLTPDKVAERHSATTYHVYMVGFLPGYPYMGDLPSGLALPRRENPRTKVPAGSIAIATTLTAVYTLESPGGWHLIGRTPMPLWDLRRDPPAVLAPGDKVRFEPIYLDDYNRLAARAEAGTFRLQPQAEPARGVRA